MSVSEAKAAIEAGLAHRLMMDWWVTDESPIYLLCPAVEGCEGNKAPEFGLIELLHGTKFGTCTFLKDGLCSIHDTSYKPTICRETFCCEDELPDKGKMVPEWDAQAGRDLVKEWKGLVGLS